MDFVRRNVRNRRWTLLTLSALLEHGTMAELRPVLARLRREPNGAFATLVEKALAMPGREYPLNDDLVRNALAEYRAAPPVKRRPRKPRTPKA